MSKLPNAMCAAPSTIKLAQQERAIADRDVMQARASFLPQADILSNFNFTSPSLHDRSTFSFIANNAIREYLLVGQVTQEFDTSGRLRAELNRARANQNIARLNVELAQREVRRAVTIAFYRLLLTRQLINTIKASLQESQSFAERTQLLFNGGEAARADVVKAAAQVAFLQQALNEADLEAKLANQDLASFWTKDADEPLALADVLAQSLTPPEASSSIMAEKTVFLKRLEFSLLDAQKRGFEADVQSARSALKPQLSFVFQYGIDSDALRWRDRGNVAYVSLRIPVFDWFKARRATEQAQLRIEQVETNSAITERSLSREYLNARARVQQLFTQITLTREQVKLSEEDLQLSRVRYEGGEGSALDVVTSQTQLAQARNNYYTSVANYLTAQAELEVAAGK